MQNYEEMKHEEYYYDPDVIGALFIDKIQDIKRTTT